MIICFSFFRDALDMLPFVPDSYVPKRFFFGYFFADPLDSLVCSNDVLDLETAIKDRLEALEITADDLRRLLAMSSQQFWSHGRFASCLPSFPPRFHPFPLFIHFSFSFEGQERQTLLRHVLVQLPTP
jgi:hypothetical protein